MRRSPPRLSAISKRYPSASATDSIDLPVLPVLPGENHAVLGENGVNKSDAGERG